MRELTTELKRYADLGETCIITINLLDLLGMAVTMWVILELVGDRPNAKGDPILMRGDSMAAVSWITRCGRARKRACVLMRMFGRLELTVGWNPAAKHIPGVRNTLADGISRWPPLLVADNVNRNEGSEQYIGSWGAGIADLVLQTKNTISKHDDILCNLMINSAEPD